MFYCEIDKTGFCFHVTPCELPLSDTIILSEENQLGRIYQNGEWVDPPEPEQEVTEE